MERKKFKSIRFPATGQYSSDSNHIPLEFYDSAFPIAHTIDMVLGYFSSNAIKTLSMSFAEFIYYGGRLNIVTNHELSASDRDHLLINIGIDKEDQVIDIFKDIELLRKELGPYGQHFFDCLKYLLKHERLTIQPVMHKPVALAHYKKILLFDGVDYLYVHGSANFTSAGIIRNGESFTVDKSWGSTTECFRIKEEIKNFHQILSKDHPSYVYLKPADVTAIINEVGNNRSQIELLEDVVDLRHKIEYPEKVKAIITKREEQFRLRVEEIKSEPHFPEGKTPKPYQIEAYNNWVSHGYSGIFAMATGTGKTITSLNCLLNEYEKTSQYHAIILVPSIALLNQWEDEVKAFNFINILKVGGGNNWETDFVNYAARYQLGVKRNLVIIATYDSYIIERFQKLFQKMEPDFTLIADEAHNMGAENKRAVFDRCHIVKRIGLSATPKRVYDDEGTIFINRFFTDEEPYIFSFSMSLALQEHYLTDYKYFPILVELNDAELEQYIEISKKLLRYFDSEKNTYSKDPMVEVLLLQRKNLIHKAANKVNCFKDILLELRRINKLKYIFSYIPEGFVTEEDGSRERMLNKFLKAANEVLPTLKMNSYTAEDQNLKDLLRGFSEGIIDLLFAMKMLDEGVDVPRAEVGIFASSTGNPRQFIQRRGRLLRRHEKKPLAYIYDMVVIPRIGKEDTPFFRMERSLVHNELRRVAYFASLAINFYDTRTELNDVCTKYNLDLDTIINEL